jgi:hypothetical protein
MTITNGTDGNKRSVSSLGELSRNVAPSRDLWPSIASQISAAGAPAEATRERVRLRPTGMQWVAVAAVVSALAVGIWVGRSVLPSAPSVQVAEEALNRRAAKSPAVDGAASENLAATTADGAGAKRPAAEDLVAARVGLTSSRSAIESLPNGVAENGVPAVDPNSLPAAFVSDPRYTMQRAALIRGLEAQLKTMPPDTQQKVASSLATIRTSITELQDALGKDPANALLQELLVNSYQDEMRVLTVVHEAGGASGGI